jgi:hypothetical protein
VPLANLVLPLPVLVTLSQASHPEYAPRSDLWRASPKRPLVPAFWAAHVVSIIVGLVLRGSVHSASSFWLTNGGMALVFSVDLLACGLGIAVVRQVSGDQRHRATRLARAGLLPEGLTDHART